MGKFIDLTGRRFGRWFVSNINPERKCKGIQWDCICECGTKRTVLGASLSSGKSLSCGCYHSELVRELGKKNGKRPYEALYHLLLKRNNVELSYDDFVEFTKQTSCHYCNTRVNWSSHDTKVRGSACNLDRTDNALGYTKDNCVVCCARCNRGKSDMFNKLQWQQLVWFMQDNVDIFREW